LVDGQREVSRVLLPGLVFEDGIGLANQNRLGRQAVALGADRQVQAVERAEPHLRNEQVRRLPIQLLLGASEVGADDDIVAGHGAADAFGDVVIRGDNKDAMKKVRHGDRSISNAYAELANRGKPLKRLGTPLGRVAKDDTKADKLYIRRTESWPVRARDAREEVCLQADFFAVSLHGLRGALLRGAFEPELRDGHLAHPELL